MFMFSTEILQYKYMAVYLSQSFSSNHVTHYCFNLEPSTKKVYILGYFQIGYNPYTVGICIHNWWTGKKRSWNLYLDCILRVYENYPHRLQNLPCCLTHPFTEFRKGVWFQISNNLSSTPDWLSLPIDFQPNVRMDQSG